MSGQRRSGRVVSVRVSTRDCMSVLDVVKAAGLPVDSLTFPAAVAQTIKILLDLQRTLGTIPDRDGFEYSEVMSTFATGGKEAYDLHNLIPAHTQGSTKHSLGGDGMEEVKKELATLAKLREEEDPTWSDAAEQRYQYLVGVYYGQ